MIDLLANAPAGISPDSNVELVLISAGVFAGVAVLASIPLVMARRHRHREIIMAVLIVWGLLSAGSISYCVMQQMNWSAERERRIESGYYDPRDVSDQPRPPILFWIVLGVVYFTTVGWALVKTEPLNSEITDFR